MGFWFDLVIAGLLGWVGFGVMVFNGGVGCLWCVVVCV